MLAVRYFKVLSVKSKEFRVISLMYKNSGSEIYPAGF